jgi:CDP-diacylglycerol--glycerol-3-phosphate 3-phosphatidyltransferase
MHRIPNLLTLFRIVLIPVFLWLVFLSAAPGRIAIALIVFAVASLTDFLDGYLARKWNVISDFGKIADPLADKLLVLSALAGLCWLEPFRLSQLIFFAIAARELGITLLREIHKRRGVIMPADKLGKLKTVLQMSGIVIAYALWAWLPRLSLPLLAAVNAWYVLMAAITIYSGLNYLKKR